MDKVYKCGFAAGAHWMAVTCNPAVIGSKVAITPHSTQPTDTVKDVTICEVEIRTDVSYTCEGECSFPTGTGHTMYVHCANCTYNVRTLYVQCPLGCNFFPVRKARVPLTTFKVRQGVISNFAPCLRFSYFVTNV